MTMLNEHLEHEIKQQVLADDDLSALRIKVSASGGVISSIGCVQSFRRKLATQENAQTTAHVNRADNRMVVAPPPIENDVAIAERANELRDVAAELIIGSLRLSAKDQTLALTGDVNTELEKTRAADIAASVDGVVEVSNFLVTNPG